MELKTQKAKLLATAQPFGLIVFERTQSFERRRLLLWIVLKCLSKR